MPRIIDHLTRKRNILSKAIELFSDIGYKQTSLSSIAEASKLSRPTLYKYFHDKDQILFFAIKDFTDSYVNIYNTYAKEKTPTRKILAKIMDKMLDDCCDHQQEILTLAEILVNRIDSDNNKLVRYRSRKLRRLLRTVIENGMAHGEIRELNVENSINTLFSMLLWSVVQIIMTPETGRRKERYNNMIEDYINLICAE